MRKRGTELGMDANKPTSPTTNSSLDALFGKSNGGFSAPIIDIGSSFTSSVGTSAGDDDAGIFGGENPLYTMADSDEMESKPIPKKRSTLRAIGALFSKKKSLEHL